MFPQLQESLSGNFRGSSDIYQSFQAIEKFVMLGCISLGILQMISLKFSDSINAINFRWMRTYSNAVPSEETIQEYLRKIIFCDIEKNKHLSISRIIQPKQGGFLYEDCS